MNKQLLFIESLVRRGLNDDDLGSVTRILFGITGIDDQHKFIEEMTSRLGVGYFTKNSFIRNAFNEHYNIVCP